MFPSLLPFEKVPVTTLVLVCYLVVILSTVIIQERLPPAPQHQRALGLNLDEAWRDLQTLTQYAHPYNSPQNDDAGEYILQRLKDIHNGANFMTLDVDLTTNVSWYSRQGAVTYMESRNILVKFEGSRWNDSAVLFTAHYDTSSLAPGATDDTIAVVSLLQMAGYLAANQPERSIIILFDDGEEDGLHGSRVFLQHPWAKLVQSFVNIEGAGAGGRPNLFRASSPEITSAFGSAAHPHGSSLFSDAFALGLIRSDTDYDVYTAAGMKGADYAFYSGRQKYHTMGDSVSSLGDRRPLWAMMENLHDVVNVLAYQPADAADVSPFAYFDVFGEAQFYLRFEMFLLLNILLVVFGPVLFGLLAYSLHKSNKLHSERRGWGRFPLALVIGIAFGVLCSVWYAEYNPMIVYRYPYTVLISIVCLTTAGTLFPLFVAHWWMPVSFQRTQVLVEMLAFWWIVEIFNLAFTIRNSFTGGYFITFFYAATLGATLIALTDMHRLHKQHAHSPVIPAEDDGSMSHGAENGAGVRDIESANERTPLIPRTDELHAPRRPGEDVIGWMWVLEFLVVAVFPAVVMFQIMWALLVALGPTVVDGSTPLFVYAIVSLTALLAILPVAPFAHKLPSTFYIVLALIGILAVIYNTLSFPFTPQSAFKTAYWQQADLQGGNSTVTLTGVQPYLGHVLKEVPSVDYDGVSWRKGPERGLTSAQFPSVAPRSFPNLPMSKWMDIEVERTGMSSLLIRISGKDTRACRLRFHGGYNVSQVLVRGSNRDGYELPSPAPVKNVDLWKRTWNGTWEVELELAAPSSSRDPAIDTAEILRGRASCIWSDRTNGRIPTLDELYVFSPTWATMTAWETGLVEGWKEFSI